MGVTMAPKVNTTQNSIAYNQEYFPFLQYENNINPVINIGDPKIPRRSERKTSNAYIVNNIKDNIFLKNPRLSATINRNGVVATNIFIPARKNGAHGR